MDGNRAYGLRNNHKTTEPNKNPTKAIMTHYYNIYNTYLYSIWNH